ncbi:MAG: ParA family protein [Mycolicibacterium sp.]|uniref:ParA family protein n=1 Tax=Mycolicibacterium sp. TaxID=2320850 RepID=UPI003D0BC184
MASSTKASKVVFGNLKGGVGKTVCTGQAAHAAVVLGHRVLIVDADPQGNITRAFTNFDTVNMPPASLADVLDRRASATIHDAIQPTRREGISILPSGFDELQAVQDALISQPGAENSLAKALREVDQDFDFIFIDSRPATDLITRAAFMAADRMIVVIQPEDWAIRGLQMTLSAVEDLKEYLDKDLPVAGWIINLVNPSRNDHAENLEQLKAMAAAENVPILGEPIPSTADLGRLSVVGMGADEHPKPTPRIRNFASMFLSIVESLSTSTQNGVHA